MRYQNGDTWNLCENYKVNIRDTEKAEVRNYKTVQSREKDGQTRRVRGPEVNTHRV